MDLYHFRPQVLVASNLQYSRGEITPAMISFWAEKHWHSQPEEVSLIRCIGLVRNLSEQSSCVPWGVVSGDTMRRKVHGEEVSKSHTLGRIKIIRTSHSPAPTPARVDAGDCGIRLKRSVDSRFGPGSCGKYKGRASKALK